MRAVLVTAVRLVPEAATRRVSVAPVRAVRRRLASSLTVIAPEAARLARPSTLVPSLAWTDTRAPGAVRTLKRSFFCLRSDFSDAVLPTVTLVSARGLGGVAVGAGVAVGVGVGVGTATGTA